MYTTNDYFFKVYVFLKTVIILSICPSEKEQLQFFMFLVRYPKQIIVLSIHKVIWQKSIWGGHLGI